MRIGIDIRTLQSESGLRGVGVYTRNLARSLLQIDSGNEYLFFASSRSGLEELPEEMKEKVVFLRRPASAIIVWDQLFWHGVLKKWNVDIFHTPFYAAPVIVPRNVAVVQTVHDLIPLLFGWSTSFRNRLVFRMNFSLLKFTDGVIAVSRNTKADIVRLLKMPEGKIEVIYNGVDHLPPERCREDGGAASNAAPAKPYLLYVGGLNPLKNIPALIQAFDKISGKNDALRLVIVGADSEKLVWAIKQWKAGKPAFAIKQRKGTGHVFHESPDLKRGEELQRALQRLLHSGRIVLKSFLQDEDLAACYRNAELFLFPSLYEGFGIPPLEAMSCGVPVVASGRASLREVLGDAAIDADPEDPDDLAAKIESTLGDEALKMRLREAGLKRAGQFRWQDTAQKTLDLYRKLHASKMGASP